MTGTLRIQILKNAVCGWTKIFILLVASYITIPLLLSHLGKEGYGIWCLISSVVGYYYLLDMGVTTSLTRLIPRFLEKGDKEGINRIISTAAGFYSAISGVLFFVTVILFFLFPMIFHLSADLSESARWVVLIMGIGIVIAFPLRCANEILYALHRYDIVSGVTSIEALLRVAIIVFIFVTGIGNLFLLGCVVTVLLVLSSVFIALLAYKKMPDISLSIHYISKDAFRKIRGLSISAFITTNSAIIFNNTFIVVTALLFNEEKIMFLAVPLLIIRYGGSLINQVTQITVPAASRYDEKGQQKQLSDLLFFGARFSLLGGLSLLFFFVFQGQSFFMFWLRSASIDLEQVQLLVKIICILLAGFVLSITQKPAHMVLKSVGKHWLVATEAVVTSLLGIVIAIVLYFCFRSLYALAIGFSTTYILRGVIYPWFVLKQFKYSLKKYVINLYVRAILGAVPVIVSVLLCKQFLPIASFGMLIANLCIIITSMLGGFYVMCLSVEQRRWMRKLISVKQ